MVAGAGGRQQLGPAAALRLFAPSAESWVEDPATSPAPTAEWVAEHLDGLRHFAGRSSPHPAAPVSLEAYRVGLDSRLSALGLVRLEDIDRDGDCYYRSWRRAMVAFGGEDYLRETVYGGRDPSVDVPREDSPDELVWARAVENYSIELMRRWLASRLEADFRAANQGLPSRYAAAFHYVDGVDPAVQQQQWLHYIRTPGEWDADIGEAVIRLPRVSCACRCWWCGTVTSIRSAVPDGVVFGARGQGRLPLILEPNHYEFGGWSRPGCGDHPVGTFGAAAGVLGRGRQGGVRTGP